MLVAWGWPWKCLREKLLAELGGVNLGIWLVVVVVELTL